MHRGRRQKRCNVAGWPNVGDPGGRTGECMNLLPTWQVDPARFFCSQLQGTVVVQVMLPRIYPTKLSLV
jgi:hypothetical protein